MSEVPLVLTEPVFSRGVLNGEIAQPLTGIYEASSSQKYMVGTQLEYPTTGRLFEYAKASSIALSKALMCQMAVQQARIIAEVQTAKTQVVGDREITVLITTGITLAEDALAGGVLTVTSSTGIGDIYTILASKVGATDTQLTLLLETPIRTALVAASILSMVKHRSMDVVVRAVTTSGKAVGVPLIDVTANYYCWLQRGGYAPLLVDTADTIVVGEPAGKPGTNAIAGTVGLVADDGTDEVYGTTVYEAQAAQTAIIDLRL